MKSVIAITLISVSVLACSSDSTDNNESTLGSEYQSYTEYSEAGNNSESVSEITAYTLDTDGIKITGSFEASGVTADYYRFNTGPYGTVTVHVFIDGIRQYEENSRVTLTLNSFIDDKYSTLFGNGYFINASVSPAGISPKDYVLGIYSIYPGEIAGSNYTIEMHHQ